MIAENKNARHSDGEASGSGEQVPSTLTTSELLEHSSPHLQITKLFLRLTKAECRDFLADLRHRHPDLWASVAGTEGATK